MSNLLLEAATELEAINFLLISIGEQPVNSLENSSVSEVHIAQRILHQVSREVQSIGLLCNTEENYPFPLNKDKEVEVPKNVLRIDTSDNSDVVLRGGKLYNRADHTYKFDATVKCDVTFFLDFEDLPPVVREYIMIRSARQFQSKTVGSKALYQFSLRDEMEAKAVLVTEQVNNGDYNMLRNISIMQMNRRT